MTLKKAVKFRFLAAQLTTTETIQFVNDNTNIILTALFHQILNTSSDGDNIINTISNIILSRKKKPKPIATQNIKLNQLPKRLIGVVSSFLNQNDNINFSKTNRFIYLGCNSPNLLQALDLIEIKDYSSINLRLFPSIKYLGLTLSQCNTLIPAMTGLPVLNELETIQFFGEYKIDSDIDNFLSSNYINTNNITKLTCTDFGDLVGTSFLGDKFMKLLTKFPNVQYLQLLSCCADINVNKIKDLYPNLKGLAANGGYQDKNRALINTFGNNLDFLSFSGFNAEYDLNLNNTNFVKLEELRILRPKIKPINYILQTAKNLKKISFHTCSTSFVNIITEKEITLAMSQFIQSCKSLQYIEFVDNGKFLASALNGIEEGLFETKNLKRNQIKIDIIVLCHQQFDPKDFTLNIGKIVRCLDYSKINDFIFTLQLRNLSNKINKNILLQELKSKCSSDVVVEMFESFGSCCVAIKNNDCRINGFYESWKIEVLIYY